MTSWQERDAAHCWHPFTRHGVAPEPLPVVGAKGAYLQLADGRRLLDGISSWWACLHGHGQPELVRALCDQAARLDHVLFAGCAHQPAAELAAELVALAPEGLQRVFYSDDGSTAVEVALKMAIQYWRRRGEPQRTRFIALAGGYHGDTFGAMAAGDPDPFFTAFAAHLFPVERVPADADELHAAIAKDPATVAAVILEPGIQAAAGMRPVPTDFLRAARRLCDDAGALLIADEVFTGLGRSGAWFACQLASVTPDIMCVAKALTNGMLPLAATLSTESIYQGFLGTAPEAMFFHGHTMTANPIACRVALESLRLAVAVDAPRLYARNGQRIAAAVAEKQAEGYAPNVAVRHMGGVVALELAAADAGYLSSLGERLRQICRRQDILLRPLGNVLYAIPPLCVTETECSQLGHTLTSICHDALTSIGSKS